MITIELLRRKTMLAGILAGSLLAGTACGGQGDPPLIVLPSAKAAAKNGIVQSQATAPAAPIAAPMAPKLEFLPPPTAEPASAKPVAPPLIAMPDIKLVLPVDKPVEKPVTKEVERETAPLPKPETKAELKLEVLPLPKPEFANPPPVAPVPGLPAPQDLKAFNTVPAALTTPAEPEKKPAPVIEKITDYAKATDVKSLMEEIAGLRKDVTALTGGAKSSEVKALKDEIESLKKSLAALTTKTGELDGIKKDVAAILAKPNELDSLKKDVAAILAKPNELDGLKKDVAAILAKPSDNLTAKDGKALKDELDTLRKDVQTLNGFIRESLDGKTVKGITSDGVVARLKRMDDGLESLVKKVQSLETKLGETRTAATITQPNTSTAAPATLPTIRGTVRVVNEYPVPIGIIINSVEHRISPGHTLDVPTAVGTFKYQLLTAGGELTDRTIKENETVTLTIR